MSYSFTVRAATKIAALDLVAVEMAKIVQNQPCHAIDMSAALSAAKAFVDMLPDTPGKDVIVSMNGSVSWTNGMPRESLCGTSMTVSAYHTPAA